MGLCLLFCSDAERNNEIFTDWQNFCLSWWIYKNVGDTNTIDGTLTIPKDKIILLHKELSEALDYFLKCDFGLYFNTRAIEFEPVFKTIETFKIPYFCGRGIDSDYVGEETINNNGNIIQYNVHFNAINELYRTKKAIESCLKYDKIYYREC